MKDAKPPIRDAVEAAVSDAYRELPQAQPSAALDARVRSGVADALAHEPAEPEVAPRKGWRRATVPLAIAATLVVAFGVGSLWLHEGGRQAGISPVPPGEPPMKIATAPQADAARPQSAPAAETPAGPGASQAEREEAPQADVAPAALSREPAAERAAPVAPAVGAIAPAPIETPMAKPALPPPPPPPEHEMSASRARLHESIAPAPAAAQARDEGPTLDIVRDLLHAGRRGAAKLVLLRWRESHPDAEIPEDLRLLAAELEVTPAPEASAPASPAAEH